MPVVASQHADVERRTCVGRERSHPVIVQAARQLAAIKRPTADVERDVHERVVHGNGPLAIPCRARWGQQSNGLTNRDPDVFDQMMPQITGGRDVQIESGITRERREHVIQERLTRDDTRFRRSRIARELDPDLDARLFGLARNRRHSPNSAAAARGSIAPVYRAIPTIAAVTPRSASARTSPKCAIPPAAYTGNAAASATSSMSGKSAPRS